MSGILIFNSKVGKVTRSISGVISIARISAPPDLSSTPAAAHSRSIFKRANSVNPHELITLDLSYKAIATAVAAGTLLCRLVPKSAVKVSPD